MSGMRNLHRIMGSQFTHFKPNLCPGCRHFKPRTDGWYGNCAAKSTVLCCETSAKAPRCQDHQKAEV